MAASFCVRPRRRGEIAVVLSQLALALISSAKERAMRILLRLLFAVVLAGGLVAPAAASPKTVCIYYFFYYNPKTGCADACSIVLKDIPDTLAAWSYVTNMTKPIPPATVMPPKPTTINSCKATVTGHPPDPGQSQCRLTLCGPESASIRDSVGPLPSQTGGTSKPARSPCAQPGDPCHQR